MNHWVNRGAKGIALWTMPAHGQSCAMCSTLRTRIWCRAAERRSSGALMIWNTADDPRPSGRYYALTQTDSMNAALMELAQQLTAENLEEAMDGLEYEVADTFLGRTG